MKKPTKNPLIRALAASSAQAQVSERRIAEMSLGIISALREGTMTVNQAWDELFNLDAFQELRRRAASAPLRELFEWGMELESVAEVSPASLELSLMAMEKLAQRVIRKSYPRSKKVAVRC